MNEDDDGFAVREVLDKSTGKAHRFYTYKGRPCHRILLKYKISAQIAGYALIEKDLRSSMHWLEEIEKLHDTTKPFPGDSYGHSKDRAKYLLIKGLFVAALTFYGKCFSRCEGRPVKLERAQLEEKYRDLHDNCIRLRHNFAAHSGAEELEHVDIAVVVPKRRKDSVFPKIYRELTQPDLLRPQNGEMQLLELFEHARQIAIRKMDSLTQKVLSEQVLPKGREYWLKR
jgi:hypothetical protein